METIENVSKKLYKYNKTVKAKIRREKVIQRLENQLKSGVKHPSIKRTREKLNLKIEGLEPLTESDIKRINSELIILKERI